MHLKKIRHLQNSGVKYLFLFRMPIPLSGPQSFWPGGPQSFSQQSAQDTGCTQSAHSPPYHHQNRTIIIESQNALGWKAALEVA